ncbi:hypothetical protein AVEN_10496-1 [Araneus ventricosus]|uniref:Uncharacterized protein n=1 Tax=Araneus ventricosus TaxID=182803 RepID=A0A4Y2JGS6_ARAVE|nr:hypothetical protein AVEN_10496-1 [Araneus ventricosus]
MSRRILGGDGTTLSLLPLPQALAHTENPIYNASKRSGMAIVQQTCKLLIWEIRKQGLRRRRQTFRNKTETRWRGLERTKSSMHRPCPTGPVMLACTKASETEGSRPQHNAGSA